MEFYTAKEAGELGEWERRDEDLPIPRVTGDSLCARVRGIPPLV